MSQKTSQTKPMVAFHDDPTIQAKYLNRVERHYERDELIQGWYVGADGDGKMRYCAVGCTIHSSNHEDYPRLLGIPSDIARLQDNIYESFANGDEKEWARNFLSVIPLGADLSDVGDQFAAWCLDDPVHGTASRVAQNGDETLASLLSRAACFIRGGFIASEAGQKFLTDMLIPCQLGMPFSPEWDLISTLIDRFSGKEMSSDGYHSLAASSFRMTSDGSGSCRDRACFVERAASELLRLMADAPVPSAIPSTI